MHAFTVGDGLYGALGLEGDGSRDLKEKPALLESLSQKQLTSVAAGWAHSAATTSDGELLVWGHPFELRNVLRLRRSTMTSGRGLAHLISRINAWLQPAAATSEEGKESNGGYGFLQVPTTVRLPPGEIAIMVACGAGITGVVCKSGALYAFGLNGYGQCGQGVENLQIWNPTRVQGALRWGSAGAPAEGSDAHDHLEDAAFAEDVCRASFGFQHGAAVTSSGRVLCWGKGERGQLGSGRRQNVPEPLLCFPPDLEDAQNDLHSGEIPIAVDVQCGLNHTACLTEDGSVYVWGKMHSLTKKKEAMSQVTTYEDQLTPRRLIFPPTSEGTVPKAVEIACSTAHTAIRTADGKVWAVGMRIGTRESSPEPVPLLDQAFSLNDQSEVVGVRGGSAGNTTALLLREGTCRTVFFGEERDLPRDVLAGALPEPWCPPDAADHVSGVRVATGTAVKDMALGWQHSLLLVSRSSE